MTKADAERILREVADSIKKGNLVLNEFFQKDKGYCETYRSEIPNLMTLAIDILKDPDKTSQADETTDPQ